ncbi:unnamed protein product, partial [Phaeothamnion confervicola]
TEIIRGLTLRHRSQLVNSMDAAGGSGSDGGGAGAGGAMETHFVTRQRQLESELLQAKLKAAAATEDGTKVLRVLELLKGKYNALAAAKTAQSAELRTAEEGRLEAAAGLLDVRLELTKQQQTFDAERFELQNEIMSARDEAVLLRKSLADERAKVAKADGAAKAAATDLAKAEAAVADMQAKLQGSVSSLEAERDRSLEIGAELLTVINQRKALQATCAKLETQVGELSGQLESCEQTSA